MGRFDGFNAYAIWNNGESNLRWGRCCKCKGGAFQLACIISIIKSREDPQPVAKAARQPVPVGKAKDSAMLPPPYRHRTPTPGTWPRDTGTVPDAAYRSNVRSSTSRDHGSRHRSRSKQIWTIRCKYWGDCDRQYCPYLHPWSDVNSQWGFLTFTDRSTKSVVIGHADMSDRRIREAGLLLRSYGLRHNSTSPPNACIAKLSGSSAGGIELYLSISTLRIS